MEENCTELIFGEHTYLTAAEEESMRYVGIFAASIGWKVNQTLEAIKTMPVYGARAGTSLRRIIQLLLNLSSDMLLICSKYNIDWKRDLNPETHSFEQIIETISDSGMSSRDIFYMMNCELVAFDIIDAVHAYKIKY
jgi:hypothetical protein